jgi:uncharacterized protein YhfF
MKGICFIEHLFRLIIDGEKTQTRRIVPENGRQRYQKDEILYLKEPYEDYDDFAHYKYNYHSYHFEYRNGNWKNKLFMPKRFARYYIKITKVSLQKLQDITQDDCVKEGVDSIQQYKDLINKINGKKTWENNPDVWVYDFQLYKEKKT